jgi:UDP-N-acetylglucosamine 2-epimerase (hydrolysing)
MTTKVAVLLGTRPEAVKLAPVVWQLQNQPGFAVTTISTGQHREMLSQALRALALDINIDLNLMEKDQTLSSLTVRAVEAVGACLDRVEPDVVLVQGDTTTSFAAALAAFYRRTPIGHVEAGLRTGDIDAPWPEEANRRLTAVIASMHFAPTKRAHDNLLTEGIDPAAVHLTGNTVTDSVLLIQSRIENDTGLAAKLATRFPFLSKERRIVLVTGHRRENFGKPLENVCSALLRIAQEHPDTHIVYPIHMNPNVEKPVRRLLSDTGADTQSRIHLIPPVDYVQLVYILSRCHFVITDSGGIQEEAPVFGKPVLVTRQQTERQEAVDAGTARLVGTDPALIYDAAHLLLTNQTAYADMSKKHNPFGDGKAAERIVEIIRERFFS